MGFGAGLRFSGGWEWLYAIAQLTIPTATSYRVARRVWRMKAIPAETRARPSRILWRGVAAAYAITGLAGGPAVQSAQNAWAISEFARLGDQDLVPKGELPRTDVYLAVPILPGVLLSYYQYTISPLYGLEAWGVFVWYGRGSRRVLEVPLSVS